MSRLTVYNDAAPDSPVLRTEEAGAIAEALRPIGVRFERWDSPVALGADATPEAILAAYRPYLDGLMGPGGAGSAGRASAPVGSAPGCPWRSSSNSRWGSSSRRMPSHAVFTAFRLPGSANSSAPRVSPPSARDSMAAPPTCA